jgi:hypothetical protein
MANNKNKKRSRGRQADAPSPAGGIRRWFAPIAIVGMLAASAGIFYYGKIDKRKLPELVKMTVAQAVMVTVELDFGGPPPAIGDAIRQIERGYEPDDGVGRTFAILDAYGEPTADGRKLHMSMHVSSEKPGKGTLKFKRTGETLWRARIGAPGDPPAGRKNLMIYLSKGDGDKTNYVLDGSRGGAGVLDAYLQNSQQRARDVWPDGAERELTFIYSACGCPVKVMCRRAGERTARTKDTPVIFPDDPAVVSTISNLMKW